MMMMVLRAHALACLVLFVVSLAGTGAFVFTPTLRNMRPATRAAFNHKDSSVGARRKVSMQAAPAEGAHGMRSRFLPVLQMDDQDFAPRMVQVAGSLREIGVQDIMAVGTSPPAELGMWQYDFSDPNGPQMGTVAVPGSEVSHNMVEPVAIVTLNEDLNVSLPEDETTECLVVVDRVDREFALGKFFLWNTAGGLQVRYFEGQPEPGYEMVGRVGLVLVPFLKSMAPTYTGFEEEEY